MVQLQPTVESFGPGDQSWLGSSHGVDMARSVTLDGVAFASLVTKGYLRSGLPLAYNSTTKKHVPYDHTATGGNAFKATLDGFLVADVPAVIVPGAAAPADISAAMLDHGRVLVNRLPVPLGTDTPTKNCLIILVTGWTGQPVPAPN